MSAGNLPYHLRPNKAVERLLFVDLLSQLDRILDLEKNYEYVGFGGPQMEDFRIMHERFRTLRMVCLEEDEGIVARQRFNMPNTQTKIINCKSSDYISKYEPRRKSLVVWLDYVRPDKRVAQIQELQELLCKAPELSIIKLTLNANVETLGADPTNAERNKKRRDRLVAQFSRFLDPSLPENIVHHDTFPETLATIIDAAAREALQRRPDFLLHPLASFVYADSMHQMLTYAGLLGTSEKINDVLARSRFAEWFFAKPVGPHAPRRIDVPELTTKERIFINQMLPRCQNNPLRIAKRLRFHLDAEADVSLRKLRQYLDFYRHYPHFGRVAF